MQGHEWLAQHMSLNDQMATLKGPLQLGQALQRVETLLAAAGRIKPEWEQHWRAAWQQRLARCYDPRDALMCAASLEVGHDNFPTTGGRGMCLGTVSGWYQVYLMFILGLVWDPGWEEILGWCQRLGRGSCTAHRVTQTQLSMPLRLSALCGPVMRSTAMQPDPDFVLH